MTPGHAIAGNNEVISSLNEVYMDLNSRLFVEVFEYLYPEHPNFNIEMKPSNIVNRVETAINSLVRNNFGEDLKGLLDSLYLLDRYNDPDISSSLYIDRIIQYFSGDKDLKREKVFQLKGFLLN